MLSGASALIYEVAWFRSLSLIFGSAHLAVTTTVSVFMLGLAIGNWSSGKYLHRAKNLLLLYGGLEIGIALSAGIFLLLMEVYPSIYVALARVSPESPFYLTFVRASFAVVAMIAPTVFMGATIPVLTKFTARSVKTLAGQLSLLYGLNTIGASVGAVVAGFYLLRVMPVSRVTFVAIVINAAIGITSVMLRGRSVALPQDNVEVEPQAATVLGKLKKAKKQNTVSMPRPFNYKLVLWGIGISGFCALGYEVLWTRVLIIFLDASTYSFTTVLVAFLLGIGLGGISYSAWRKIFGSDENEEDAHPAAAISNFGIVQILIGLSSLLVIYFIYDLPSRLVLGVRFFYELSGGFFSARQFSNFWIAFLFLFVPTFLMGLAVPLAGRAHAQYRRRTGQAVGELLTYNTIGAILGAALSGFLLIHLFGIQRSLQLFAAVNIGLGVIVIASVGALRPHIGILEKVAIAVMLFMIFNNGALKAWDARYLASYTPNNAPAYLDKKIILKALDDTEILYYGEGRESIVSSTMSKSTGLISFTVNGRVEASTKLEDVQLQYMIGHLPMLLHKSPKDVLVIGAGSGMSLGAVSVHPSVESVTLAEIEPKVLGVARTFSAWNHNVLDNPKLRVVFNDGRNFLLTSQSKFDVITTDPIHPSWRGSGYLYTKEYFKLAAKHLASGGIISQWLPLYQLSVANQRSIAKTFRENFKYVMVWLTLTDMVLVGSNDPLVIDEELLNARMREPNIAVDFKILMINSSSDMLSYFLMGSSGVEAFGDQAVVNSDDNVYLEFSSPRSIGNNSLEAKNVAAMTGYRESILPFLRRLQDAEAQRVREKVWADYADLVVTLDRAQIIYLDEKIEQDELQGIRTALDDHASLSRGRSLKLVMFGQN